MVRDIRREWWLEREKERLKRKGSSEHNWTFLCVFSFLSGLEEGVRQDLGHMVIIPSEIPSATPTVPSLFSKPSPALSA